MRCSFILLAFLICESVGLAADLPHTRPVPRLQVLPQPYAQASFQRDGVEIARYHFGPDLRRPFLFPLIGPSGRSVTRMGHPHDPEGHSHHNSVWITHNDVNGVVFWSDRQSGKILHQRIEKYEDLADTETAYIQSTNHWIDEKSNNTVLLFERRRTTLQLLPNDEYLVLLDIRLELPPKATEPVTFGKTPFGLVGVRMAKTIGVNDGGGVIRNSEGQVNEKEIFWKPARWCDYSGPQTPTATEGATLFDHPANPNHPTVFHVRSDGWMGASLTHTDSLTITREKPLQLRYGIYIHAGTPGIDQLEKQWKTFAQTERPNLEGK